MSQPFHLSLESPQCGFMALSVSAGDGFVRYGAAHQPFDSLGDLLRGVTALLQGRDALTIQWNAEPEQYDWCLAKDGELVALQIIHYPDQRRAPKEAQEVFVYSLPLRELARDLESEARELQERAERDVFPGNWRREFPATELAQLSAALQGE